MGYYDQWAPYVSVAERKKQAEKEVAKLKKKGQDIQPIVVEGRKITKTFWGNAWCKNLEIYSDYANRLPRGRSYLRNGSVIDLKVKQGEITALVNGSSLYKISLKITKVTETKWNNIVSECSGKIDSLIELLQGNFSNAVMKIITDPDKGLFPHPKEMKLSCSCPDSARMCKHIAAVLYGVGARLDMSPEELFLLRQADHLGLISKASATSLMGTEESAIDDNDLSSLFGIDIKSKKPKAKKKKAK